MTFSYLDPMFRASLSTDIFERMHEVDPTRAVMCNNRTRHSNKSSLRCAGNVEGNGLSLPYTTLNDNYTLNGSQPLDIMTRILFGNFDPLLGMQNMTS